MMLVDLQTQVKRNLEFYILYYTYHNRNVPFSCKTISFALKELKYKSTYVGITLSRLRRCRYLTEPILGIYVMTEESFQFIKDTNPELAQEIKSKLKYQKTVNCQKSIC